MIGSPYIARPHNSVRLTMLQVLALLLPGAAAHAWYFGPGIWISLAWCSVLALAFEAAALALRRYPLRPFLGDGSALVTAWLFALTVPTLAPWWLYAVGMLFAIVVTKHLYGGLGQNPFNPAMVGYAVLIISFPMQMTQWPGPLGVVPYTPDLAEALAIVFDVPGRLAADAYTMASPLDALRTRLHSGQEIGTALSGLPGHDGTLDGEIVALLFLLGGLVLLARRLITWHVPVAFLAGVVVSAGLLQWIDPARHIGPLFHLLSGGVMLGAFFIATDPVSGCTTPLGKLIFAGLAGVLTLLIRTFGGFPDGVAFAILLMNIAAPFIDTYTQPRVYGGRSQLGRRPGDGA
jgi:electron transport complex protein RnfD